MNERKNLTSLLSISPIDGRYKAQTFELSDYFSEFALIKTRVEIEIDYLIFLIKNGVAPRVSLSKIENIYKNFSLEEAQSVKKIESEIGHDVKAVEYFIAAKLKVLKLSKIRPYVHFALTSDDINNLAYRLMIKRSLNNIILPQLSSLTKNLSDISHKYANVPMLARTHGQPAVSTTFGKEMTVFLQRLKKQLIKLKSVKMEGKFGGAVGNWNAQKFSFPKKNWIALSSKFIKTLGFSLNVATTQIAPPEDILEIFSRLIFINNIIYDLDCDMWRYISDGWVTKKFSKNIVGSSTMPQKVNPVNFENSEGNVELANAFFQTFISTLPVSRLQRDLSDSTVMRNIGSAFSYSLIAYKNTKKGLAEIALDKAKMKNALEQNWNILSEALQTLLRKEGHMDAYEKVTSLMKGKVISENSWYEIIKNLNISKENKTKLQNLAPEKYIGLSVQIVKKA